MEENETHQVGSAAPAPMAAAPMRYDAEGKVDWGKMWDSFCVLARDGGPPHRGELLEATGRLDVAAPAYRAAEAEIGRGIRLVCGLDVSAAGPGWLAVHCHSKVMAQWLAEAISEENVAVRAEDGRLLVPVSADFTVKGEIKSVITAVAKTTHYWRLHLSPEVKQTLAAQAAFGRLWAGLRRLAPRRANQSG